LTCDEGRVKSVRGECQAELT